MYALYLLSLLLIVFESGCSLFRDSRPKFSNHFRGPQSSVLFPREKFFKKLSQITYAGNHFDARWSESGSKLVFNHVPIEEDSEYLDCPQVFMAFRDGTEPHLISNVAHGTSSPLFLPHDERVLYSTYFPKAQECIVQGPFPDPRIYENFYFYGVLPNGRDPIPLEPGAPKSHNSQASVCVDSKGHASAVFTSNREGSLNLFSAQLDRFGSFNEIKNITKRIGYNGWGAFSKDCKKIVWSSYFPQTVRSKQKFEKNLEQYRLDLPSLEIWISEADGSHPYPVTRLNSKSFAPEFTPDGKNVVFTSLVSGTQNNWEIFKVSLEDGKIQQVTNSGGINLGGRFSPDGRFFVFSSDRGVKLRELNLIVAEWNSKD